MKKLLIITALASSLILFWCNVNKSDPIDEENTQQEEIIEIETWEVQEENLEINNFQDCVDAGLTIMESYPRQCGYNWIVFTEEVPEEIQENTDIKDMIDDLKNNQSDWDKLDDKDIDLMEKVIEKIEE